MWKVLLGSGAPAIQAVQVASEPIQMLDPWYVTGLVEGEGTFTYNRSPRNLMLVFAVKLIRADDQLLITLQRFFGGIGTIYRVRLRAATPKAGFTKAASYFRVCRIDQLQRVVEHFDEYPLRGAKAHSFAIWRLMVLLKREFPKTARNHLLAFAKKLSASSPRNGRWDPEDPDAGPYRPPPLPSEVRDYFDELLGDSSALLENRDYATLSAGHA
jgi:LAGLIDADG DNA endonuclease family protein